MVQRSDHQQRIDSFMQSAGQALPAAPLIPPDDVRLLRAKLILEEALETICALGVEVALAGEPMNGEGQVTLNPGCKEQKMGFVIAGPCNLVEVADGCADLSVVTIGTLSAFGISDTTLLAEVDRSNLDKFGEGAYRRDDGKWMKGPKWLPPNIEGVLHAQGY